MSARGKAQKAGGLRDRTTHTTKPTSEYSVTDTVREERETPGDKRGALDTYGVCSSNVPRFD